MTNRLGFIPWVQLTFQSSVLDDVWGQVLTMTAWATLWTALYQFDIVKASCDASLLGILSGLLGFVVSLRTSSAYERYCEGRRCWSSVFNDTRVLAQLVWFHVKDARPIERPAKEDMTEQEKHDYEMEKLEVLLEKKSFLNLLNAFAVAVKHYCRDEPGPYYDDLYPLIQHLPRYAHKDENVNPELLPLWQAHRGGKTFIPTDVRATYLDPGSQHTLATTPMAMSEASTTDLHASQGPSQQGVNFAPEVQAQDKPRGLSRASTMLELAPGRAPPKKDIFDHIPLLGWFRSLLYMIFAGRTRSKTKDAELALAEERSSFESNAAVEIVLFLSNWVASADRRALCEGALTGNILAAVYQLNTCISSFERLISTPLPYAYKLHLRLTVWLFLLTANFQVVATLGWVTIPGMTIASLFYLGFLEIGQEIENPFDYGKNDLDLDLFCAFISKELAEVTSHGNLFNDPYMLSSHNRPFESAGDARSAADILQECSREGPETVKTVRRSIANHFRHAAQVAALSSTRAWRKQQKRRPRSKVEVDHAD